MEAALTGMPMMGGGPPQLAIAGPLDGAPMISCGPGQCVPMTFGPTQAIAGTAPSVGIAQGTARGPLRPVSALSSPGHVVSSMRGVAQPTARCGAPCGGTDPAASSVSSRGLRPVSQEALAGATRPVATLGTPSRLKPLGGAVQQAAPSVPQASTKPVAGLRPLGQVSSTNGCAQPNVMAAAPTGFRPGISAAPCGCRQPIAAGRPLGNTSSMRGYAQPGAVTG